jgi:hypothetical protein
VKAEYSKSTLFGLGPGKKEDIIVHEKLQQEDMSGAADEDERQARKELELYGRRGQAIRAKCFKYCENVFAKIDHLIESRRT